MNLASRLFVDAFYGDFEVPVVTNDSDLALPDLGRLQGAVPTVALINPHPGAASRALVQEAEVAVNLRHPTRTPGGSYGIGVDVAQFAEQFRSGVFVIWPWTRAGQQRDSR